MASSVGMLRGMFEQVDEDVIVTVLEINGGNVERTIDQLLQIQGGEQEVQSTAVGDADRSSQSLSASSSSSSSSASASASDSALSSASPSGDSLANSSRRRVQLPDDYLRVPGIAGSYSTPAASGQGEDEYMAQVRRGPGRREGGVAVPLSVKLCHPSQCTFYSTVSRTGSRCFYAATLLRCYTASLPRCLASFCPCLRLIPLQLPLCVPTVILTSILASTPSSTRSSASLHPPWLALIVPHPRSWPTSYSLKN